MITLPRVTVQRVLEALKDYERHTGFGSTATDALRAALWHPEQEPCDIAADGVCEALECCNVRTSALCTEQVRTLKQLNVEMLAALIDLTEAGAEAWGEDRQCVRIGLAVIAKAEGQA